MLSWWIPRCWHFKKYRLVAWVMALDMKCPQKIFRKGLIGTVLWWSRGCSGCHALQQGSMFADRRAYTMFTRPSVYHHRQTAFSRKGEKKSSWSHRGSSILLVANQTWSFQGAWALASGRGFWRLLKGQSIHPQPLLHAKQGIPWVSLLLGSGFAVPRGLRVLFCWPLSSIKTASTSLYSFLKVPYLA